jgi:hypothetical protein
MSRTARLVSFVVTAAGLAACSNPTSPRQVRCLPMEDGCTNINYVNPNVNYVNPNVNYVNPNVNYVNPNV